MINGDFLNDASTYRWVFRGGPVLCCPGKRCGIRPLWCERAGDRSVIRLPLVRQGPLRALALRVVAAVVLVLLTVLVIYIDRDGYRDVNEDGLTLLDCFYYAAVSLSTTGYG